MKKEQPKSVCEREWELFLRAVEEFGCRTDDTQFEKTLMALLRFEKPKGTQQKAIEQNRCWDRSIIAAPALAEVALGQGRRQARQGERGKACRAPF
jgi:hypothetical protein